MPGAPSLHCAIFNNDRIQNFGLVVINRRMDAFNCNRPPKRQPAFTRLKPGLRQFIAAYLAACLVLAGVAGLSPALHTLIEHGGKGAPHVHGQLDSAHANPASHRHADGKEHSHAHSENSPASGNVHAARIFAHSSGAFPGADALAARLWQRVQDWLAQQESSPASSDAGGEHHHDSLASLLTGGLIDQADPAVSCDSEPAAAVLRCSPSSDRIHAFDWEARFAPRGPPAVQG